MHEKQQHKFSNDLVKESSPYLLQHAHNPVNWRAWNEDTLSLAKEKNKIILVSIGYSACHWCHVMERECFEDEKVAQIMNDHFVCIKVDREERPDIDQVYMMAVQLMTGHGGWPLNCFALPDGRPVYGGTYFPKQQWINILLNISDLYQNEPEKVVEYAVQLTEGLKLSELVKNEAVSELDKSLLLQSYQNWKPRLDNKYGGPDKAPKFPLPNNYQFLLRLASSSVLPEEEKEYLKNHISLSLKKMAYGGIYDQVGGGFARYSVDAFWKVPHFEKMLYDNAQLVTLYSEAYTVGNNQLYKEIVLETLAFIERELSAKEGGFFSALDADSEGVEGKFYVWTKAELETLLEKDFQLAADYFNVNEAGFWEHENYILLREEEDEVIAQRHNLSVEVLRKRIFSIKTLLLKERSKRVRPGLDNKILCSWNALMIKAYVDAYNAFEDRSFLETAEVNMNFIIENCLQSDFRLLRLAGNNSINGFLEDYCFTIEALISLYEAGFDESRLLLAKNLMEYCIMHFRDEKTRMFYFTSDEDAALVSRRTELADNVIPASNSSMAKNLFLLGHYFEDLGYIEDSRAMLSRMTNDLLSYGAGYSNWAMLLQYFSEPFFEVAIVGKAVDELRRDLKKRHLPNLIFAGSKHESALPLLRNRYVADETLIYVCRDFSCLKPEKEIAEALKHLKKE